MSTKGCADVVFCLDASLSMEPCFQGVCDHVSDFLTGLQSRGQMTWDLRVDFTAHSVGMGGKGETLFRHSSLHHEDLHAALYESGQRTARLFTTDLAEFQRGLRRIECRGDEAPMVGLDFCLDFPWRSPATCHRVVILLTDEAMETGQIVAEQKARIPAIIDKIQRLRLMLFIVAPESPGFDELAQVDKAEYERVDVKGDGLANLDFGEMLGYVGKSVSVMSLQLGGADKVERGLFSQARWGVSEGRFTGE